MQLIRDPSTILSCVKGNRKVGTSINAFVLQQTVQDLILLFPFWNNKIGNDIGWTANSLVNVSQT